MSRSSAPPVNGRCAQSVDSAAYHLSSSLMGMSTSLLYNKRHHHRSPLSLPHSRFYSSARLPRHFEAGFIAELAEAVTHHAIHALRLREGDSLVLFDGEGGEFRARIHEIKKQRLKVELLAFQDISRESPLKITLAQALTTGDKMDLIIQKAVELGVACIQPLHTARCTARLSDERAAKRLVHWRAIAISACEQCGRNRLPTIEPVKTFNDWISLPVAYSHYLLWPEATQTFSAIASTAQLGIVVGPEGGFEPREIEWAVQHGIQPVRLGPRVLRTETAGLAALAGLSMKTGDFA